MTNSEMQKLLKFLSGKVDDLERRLEKIEGSKQRNGRQKTQGSQVWEVYHLYYQKRYGTEPVRNAMANKHCSDLVKRVGLEDAKKVVQYYVSLNDQFYVKNMHGLRYCLKDCEGLVTRVRKGITMTNKKAQRAENVAAGLMASQSYLEEKYGKTD